MTRRSFASEDALVVDYLLIMAVVMMERRRRIVMLKITITIITIMVTIIALVMILYRGCCNDNDFFQLVQGGVEKLKTEQKYASLA